MLFDSSSNQLSEPDHGFTEETVPMWLCKPLLLSGFRAPYADSLTIVSGGVKAFATRTADGLLRITMGVSVAQVALTGGPGTELKKLLTPFFKTTATCGCNKMVSEMDRLGPEWCIKNTDKIVSVMEKEAAIRKIPFSCFFAERLVLFSIRRFLKSETKRLAKLQFSE